MFNHGLETKVAPSILAADFTRMAEALHSMVCLCPILHLDSR